MATFSNLKTIKISQAVSIVKTGSTALIYTCPASTFAVLNIVFAPGVTAMDQATIYLGTGVGTSGIIAYGVRVNATDTYSTFNPQTPNLFQTSCPIYIGPGMTITADASGGTIYITGVEYINNPI